MNQKSPDPEKRIEPGLDRILFQNFLERLLDFGRLYMWIMRELDERATLSETW